MPSTEAGRPRPKYQRIADALKGAIEAGEYAPGDRLPGENELMASYGVARMTARQALGVLRNEGIAEARKGSGVFVRDFRPLRRLGVQRLAREGWSSGRSVWTADLGDRQLVVDQVEVGTGVAPQRVAEVTGQDVLVRARRFVLDGKPVLLATSYLPAALVAGSAVTREDPGPGGIYARLAELGHAPVRFREEVRSRMPSHEEADALGLADGTPVILICRTAYATEDRVVEVNEMVLDSAAYVLEYDFDA
ncbi:GntR family transcriptional regulator [Streptomyces sp. ICBB 8177]|uniref:GntR family transcriptional regulator n=1 Tax=Streptomyces sp. ICBB 8177 TaxID=563922 RepID=UPI000D67E259|nr:GntR family transcriptional regulator [Streptomyces sp. ICBB 8177]PWI41156.1 GntR family transcriptional regulator [Streptomyces sp. ICBB 8177]